MDEEPKDVPIDLSFAERRFMQRMQPELRDAATEAGHHRTCRLPNCRRAKRCAGCHHADEIATTHYKTFPPCVHDNATQASLLDGWSRLGDLQWQQWLAAGYTAEELERLGDERTRAMEESDDWPDDPIRPVTRASRRSR